MLSFLHIVWKELTIVRQRESGGLLSISNFGATPSIGRELAVAANQVLNFTFRRRALALAYLSAQKEQKKNALEIAGCCWRSP